MTYNKFTINEFTLSAFGEANIVCATAVYWVESDDFTPELNASIRKVQAMFPKEDTDIIFNSWDLERLGQIFEKHYGYHYIYQMDLPQDSYLEMRSTIWKVSAHAIKSNPAVYSKFFTSMMHRFFSNIRHETNFYLAVEARHRRLFIKKDYGKKLPPEYRKFILSEYYAPAQLSKFSYEPPYKHIPTRVSEVHKFLTKIHRKIFSNLLWSWIYFAALIASFIRLVQSRFRNVEVFLYFAALIAAFGGALIVCLVEIALVRYSFPMEFTYYLALALCPIIILPANKEKRLFYLEKIKSKFQRYMQP